ncbi:MAG: hypothetical protein MHM6MM_004042 [Cercozoa sp. M6MM]
MSSDKVERRERFGRRRGGAARRGKTVRKDDARNLAVLRITKHSVADFVWDQDWTPKISTPQELKDNTVFLNIARTFVRRRSAPTSENTLVEIRIVELESVKHLHAPSVLTFCLSPEGKRVLPTDLTEHVWIEVETKPQKSKSALFPEKQRGDKYWWSIWDMERPKTRRRLLRRYRQRVVHIDPLGARTVTDRHVRYPRL